MLDQQATKKLKLNKIFENSIFQIGITVLLILAVLVGIYYWGYHNGERHQRQVDLTAHSSTVGGSQGILPFLQNRWTIVGTIQSVSSSSIKIAGINGQTKTTAVNSSTIVTSPTAQTSSLKALQNGQKIIATGTKDSKGNYTATRIRVE